MSFTLIGMGNLTASDNIPKQNIIIRDSTAWSNILNALSQETIQQFTETTNIDFNNYQLIAVFDTPYPSSTFDLEIIGITEYENKIEVARQYFSTPTATIVYPQSYHIVKMRKSTKPIVL
ncbi:MAG: hypothetical protein H7195_11025 [Chryseobacterium sp.]|nr:hypothetical protein [Chryseobacterium sp.]